MKKNIEKEIRKISMAVNVFMVEKGYLWCEFCEIWIEKETVWLKHQHQNPGSPPP